MEFKQDKMVLSQINSFYSSGRISMNPKYQREHVWSRVQNQKLIESLLTGYGTQKFLFTVVNNEKDNSSVYEVVDGQQRLNAIVAYMGGIPGKEFSLPVELKKSPNKKLHPYAGIKFKKLPPALAEAFMEINIDVVKVEDATDGEIRELFLAWNNGTPLRGMELISPIGGAFITKTLSLVKTYKTTVFSAVKSQANRRGQFTLTVARMLAAFLNGTKNKVSLKRYNERQIKEHAARFGKSIKSDIFNRIISSLDFINASITKELTDKNIKLSKATFVTLVYVTDHILQTYAQPSKSEYKKQFMKFLSDLNDAEEDPKHKLYSVAMSNADSEHSWVIKFDAMLSYFTKNIMLSEKDKKRRFNNSERHIVFQKYNGLCAECGIDCTYAKWEIDHIIPHSSGGKTKMINGRLLCRDCNNKKGALIPT